MAHQPSGWYTDPTGRYEYRYWNGSQWTTEVSSAGTSTADASTMDPSMANTPPAPGTAAPSAPPPPTQPAVQVTQKSGSAIGTIIGVALGVIAVIVLILILLISSFMRRVLSRRGGGRRVIYHSSDGLPIASYRLSTAVTLPGSQSGGTTRTSCRHCFCIRCSLGCGGRWIALDVLK